jgi:hypothetical protein
MKRLCGASLIAVGLVGPTLAVWWMFTSGYMEANAALAGPKAFAGVIVSGLICIIVGAALWIAPRASG